ncbi:hypothetical protein L1987_71083 [Smallanthus sonchifolius]|uniref:Uncharacterized protein n=1 Tax=Smallanthus sonchifolius TaxID=185202 RepID=A0ACB9AVR5_9ASTR|nr:hypothetical protein L1987_71083 [Smallanthus sonchifolius]
MGTNFPSFLQEAHRVLKPSGWLLIAEVKSRFNPNNGGADPDRFSQAVCDLGFILYQRTSQIKCSYFYTSGKRQRTILARRLNGLN